MELSFFNHGMLLGIMIALTLLIGYIWQNRKTDSAWHRLLPVHISPGYLMAQASDPLASNPYAQNISLASLINNGVSDISDNTDKLPQSKKSNLHKPTVKKLIQNIGQALRAEAVGLYLLDYKLPQLSLCCIWHQQQKNLEPATEAIGQGIIGLAAQLAPDQTLLVSDVAADPRFAGNGTPVYAFTNAIAAPIFAEDSQTLLAVILVVNKQPAPQAFSPADQKQLVPLLKNENVHLYVQNLRQLQRQYQRETELQVINQMIQAIADPSALGDVQSACRVILTHPSFKELFEFDATEICLWDEQTQTLKRELRLPENAADDHPFEIYAPNEGYSGWIAANRVSLLVPNAATFSEATPKLGVDKLPYRSFLGVPLRTGERFLGTLELASRTTNAFALSDVTLLEIVGNQVAIALENVRLFNLTNEELQRRVEELAGLQRVSSELNSTLDLSKILSLVREEALRLTQADYCDVFFYHAANKQLVAYQDTAAKGVRLAIAANSGLVERILHGRQSALINDASPAEDFIDLNRETRSKVAVPVHYGGEPIGLIALESKKANFFSRNQLRYLESLANNAAVAIGNARAYRQQILEREQASRRAEQLARLSEISNAFRTNRPLGDVLEDIAFAIAEAVGFDVVLISLITGNPPQIVPQVGAGIPLRQMDELKKDTQVQPATNLEAILLPEFNVGKSYFIPAERMSVWQNRLNIPYFEKTTIEISSSPASDINAILGFTTDKSRWESGDLLLVPLTDTAENTIGLLTVANPIDDLRPDTTTVQALETFANHAAGAIENAQLFDLEQQRRRLADTLRGVAEAISSQLEFDELLNIILQELTRVLDYDIVNVQLLQEDKLKIIGGRGWEDGQQLIGLSFSMTDENPSRQVIESQEPVIIGDVRQTYADVFSDPRLRHVRSWLGVPLTYGTNVLGVMVLYKAEPDFYTREDRDVFMAFANQVAVALQNAQLFDEARQQVRQLAALTDVAQSINRALALNDVLDLVLEAVFDLVGHNQGSIWLIDSGTNTLKMANTKNVPEFLVGLFNDSNVPLNSEPFTSVISTKDVVIVQGDAPRDTIANFGLPFPNDVTYVPLKTEEGVIGILAIETVIQNKNMLKLVTTLADLAAVAIESARLLEDTRRRATEMQNLYNLGVEVSGLLDVRQVMRLVVSNVLRLMSGQLGAILFVDDQTGRQIMETGTANYLPAGKFGFGTQNLQEATQLKEASRALWASLTDQIKLTHKPVVMTLPSLNGPEGKPGKQTLVAEQSVQKVLASSKKLGIKAIAGVPIYLQNRINGAIFVTTQEPRRFEERDIQSLSFVANQASVAIQNAQLVQRLNQLTEELEQRVAQRTEELAHTLQDLTEERDRVGTLYQIARELSTSFDLERVLNEALNLLNRAVGISHGAILLVDRETNQLVYRAALGRNKPLPRGGVKTPYKLGYGLAGKIMENREPRQVYDLQEESAWIATASGRDDRRAAIGVPLSTGDDVMGVLLLFHPEPGYFTDDHLKLVTAASAQIATAVNNAELYGLISDQAKRLGVLYRQQASEAAKNQAILEGITDGVLVLDANRNIVLMNPKSVEILNVNAAELDNQPLKQILGRSATPVELDLTQALYENLLVALSRIEAGEKSATFRIESGPKAVLVALAPVVLGAEDQSSVVAVLRDISREAEIDRLKNEFISTVSHELRTPMTSIKGYADLLLSGNSKIGELNTTQHRFVKVIQSNANRLTVLVNDILEISRIETGRVKLELTSVDLVELIREVAVSFKGQMVQKAIHLNLHLPEQLAHVYADKAKLTQVMVNLIGNGWQYTPEGGQVNVFARQIGNMVQVDVADTGIGIVEKDQPYIFERFFRSERTEVQVVDGTGLGLSITKSFVEMLGGQIWVKSKLDVGTTFSFTVPVDLGDESVNLEQLTTPARTEILLVGVDTGVANRLSVEMQRRGLNPSFLENAEIALEMIRSKIHTIRAVVLDSALHDGLSLLQWLKRQPAYKSVPVFLAGLRLNANSNADTLAAQIVQLMPATDVIGSVTSTIQQLVGVPEKLRVTRELGAKSGDIRVLIINPNRQSCVQIKNILVSSGHNAYCAFNGWQALDMAIGNRPDIILLSMNIPEIDGQPVVAHLRQDELTQSIPVILMIDEPEISPQNGVFVLGQQNYTPSDPLLSVQDVVAEIFSSEMPRDRELSGAQ